jgi:hypothetical protein
MPREPVLSGEITREGMLEVIQEVERRRTTGVLAFEGDDVSGEVDLVAGQIAIDQKDLSGGRDPVEVLLALRAGSYRVYQRLPPLPVSKGDDFSRTGSLAVHVPADLMNYCEHAGMTGTLRLENSGRRAEAVYHSGDLVAIRVEGTDVQDLHEVFGWEEGTFHIRAFSQLPAVDAERPIEALPVDLHELDEAVAAEVAAQEALASSPPKRRDETGQQFLRSVEVALTEIVEEREKRRSPTRTSPPLPPKRKARGTDSFPGIELPPVSAPPKKRREPTVRVIYLSARPSAAQGVTHVRKDVAGEGVLPEASPERRSGEAARRTAKTGRGEAARRTSIEPDAPSTAAATAETSLAGTLGWVVIVLVLLVAALAVLAWLPPIE